MMNTDMIVGMLNLWADREPDICERSESYTRRYLIGPKRLEHVHYHFNLPSHPWAIVGVDKRGYTETMGEWNFPNVQTAVQEAVTAKGWGWTKDYMLRNDVSVMVPTPGHATLAPHEFIYRCDRHGTRKCSTSLAENLLSAYLQALEAHR